jgi:hypothetical protein
LVYGCEGGRFVCNLGDVRFFLTECSSNCRIFYAFPCFLAIGLFSLKSFTAVQYHKKNFRSSSRQKGSFLTSECTTSNKPQTSWVDRLHALGEKRHLPESSTRGKATRRVWYIFANSNKIGSVQTRLWSACVFRSQLRVPFWSR